MVFTSPSGGVDTWDVEAKDIIYGNGVRYTVKLLEATTKEFHLIDWVEDMTRLNTNPLYFNRNSGKVIFEGENVFIEQDVVYPVSLELINKEYILVLGR
jgi:hypothetical protein